MKKQANIGIELERNLWESLAIPKDSVILDIGCGPGMISGKLAKYASDGKVIEIDKNRLMIEACSNNEGYKNIANLSFREGAVLSLGNIEFAWDAVGLFYSIGEK